jgi:hypothetical protein
MRRLASRTDTAPGDFTRILRGHPPLPTLDFGTTLVAWAVYFTAQGLIVYM